ncbi:cytochrome P450 [Trametopsis cervina]|nr:cytochrome P450 [Trametopsis cervina]
MNLMANVPGMRPLVAPMSLLGVILPTTWWNLVGGWCWQWRESVRFSSGVVCAPTDIPLGNVAKYSTLIKIRNAFSMMFADHETTARTFASFLAVHQEKQQKAIDEIKSVIGNGQERLDDVPRLEHLLACFYETVRIFPPGVTLTRSMVNGHTISSTRPTKQSVPSRKGNFVLIDMIGVHHDPETFPEPETFRPSRWYDVLDQDVSMFGLGPRACVGRKFAQTEALCFLALFLRDWKVEPVLEGGESPADYEHRVMTKACSLSLGFGWGL